MYPMFVSYFKTLLSLISLGDPTSHLNRPTAASKPDSAAPRLVCWLQWACFGDLRGPRGLLTIQHFYSFHQVRKTIRIVSTYTQRPHLL